MKQRLRDLEARENWIQARVDELMDSDWLFEQWEFRGNKTLEDYARGIAEKEHAAIMADLEEAIIDSGVYE